MAAEDVAQLFPLIALDHIFFSPGIQVESVETAQGLSAKIASDHLAVIATFRVRDS